MKEVNKNIDVNYSHQLPIASVMIEGSSFSHLLVYEKYCQVVIGHVTSMTLSKASCLTILDEMKDIRGFSGGVIKSKVFGVKYTFTGITINNCKLTGKEGWDGLIQALTLYCNDGPYLDDDWVVIQTKDISEVIVKTKIGTGLVNVWWYIGKSHLHTNLTIKLCGPYELFYYNTDSKEFITALISAVEVILNTEEKEVKIELSEAHHRNLNLRIFKQMVSDEPAVCISTDSIFRNQRSLVFISKESGKRFLEFLNKSLSLFY